MSMMSASPVKPAMPAATPPKVLPTAPTSNNVAPAVSLGNQVAASPTKSVIPTPPQSQNSSVLSVPVTATPSISPSKAVAGGAVSTPLNMNHSVSNAQVPLSLITTDHKTASGGPLPSALTVRTPEKQTTGESYAKPTSNGVEGQPQPPTSQVPSLTITPVVLSTGGASQQPQHHPPVSSSTAETAGHNAVSTAPKPVPVATTSEPPKGDIGVTSNQQPLSLSLNAVSPHKPLPPASQPLPAAPRLAPADKSSDSVVPTAASTVPLQQRADSSKGVSNQAVPKVDPVVVKKPEQSFPATVGKTVGGAGAAVAACPQPQPQTSPATAAKVVAESQPRVESAATAKAAASAPVTATADGHRAATTPADVPAHKSVAERPPPAAAKPVATAAEATEPASQPPAPSQTPSSPAVSNSTPPSSSSTATSKAEMKVATLPRGSKRKRETKQPSLPSTPQNASVTTSGPATAQGNADAAKGETPDDRKSKRVRLPTQPYQSPLPEFSLIAKMNKSTPNKTVDDKLIVFYKNEFLAVRNAEGSFYICQAMQNVYKSSPKIRIRWLSQEATTQVYSPDFYDTTDFDCILTNINMEKVEKEKFRLPPVELHRTESILKRALDVEKGVSEKPSVTEEHPDGLDLSLFRDESQLKKPSKRAASASGSAAAAKGPPAKKPSRSSTRSTASTVVDSSVLDDEDDEDEDEDDEYQEKRKRKKRRKDKSVAVAAAKPSKKKKKKQQQVADSGKKKLPAATGTKRTAPAAVKPQSNTKASQAKKKKKKKAAPAAVTPVAAEPTVKPAVKRKRSTSTPPQAPSPAPTTAKRAKKADATQPKELEEKPTTKSRKADSAAATTAVTSQAAATSKSRSGAPNSTSSPSSTTAEKSAAPADSQPASAVTTTRQSGTPAPPPAASKETAAGAVPSTSGKDNREQRRAAKSRK